MSKERETNQPDLIAYAVSGSGEKSFYHRIGAAWRNSKGGAKVIGGVSRERRASVVAAA